MCHHAPDDERTGTDDERTGTDESPITPGDDRPAASDGKPTDG